MARSNNNNKLKAFVRFDGSGRIVPSSLIVQAFKPKVGNWKEIDAKECCNFVMIYYIPETYPIVNPHVNVFCNGINVVDEAANGYTANDINELVVILNNESGTSTVGRYVAQFNGSVKLTISQSVAKTLCSTGTLSFEIIPD